MKSRFFLPADLEARQAALCHHHDANRTEHLQKAYEWTRNHWYLQGVRALRLWGQGGVPSGTYRDDQGRLRIRIEKAFEAVQVAQGQILNMDLGPAIVRDQGVSLTGVRDTALLQTTYDYFWDRFDNTTFQAALSYILPAYGSCGIGGFAVPGGQGGVLGGTLMVIPPWQLRPLPSCPTGIEQVAGIEFFRWAPYDWIKANFKDLLRFPKDDADNDLNLLSVPIASNVGVEYTPGSLQAGIGWTGMGQVPGVLTKGQIQTVQQSDFDLSKDKNRSRYVEMREFWVYGDDFSCLQWHLCLGRKLVLSIDYTNERDRKRIGMTGNKLPIAPVHMTRWSVAGSFWGRGLAERLIPMNRQFEDLFGQCISNLKEAEFLRFLAIPTTLGLNHERLVEQRRNGILFYQPDLAAPQHLKPEVIAPPTIGDAPGKMLGTISALLDMSSQQSPAIKGKIGRISSEKGLNELVEQQETPLEPVARSLASAMTGAYKALGRVFQVTLKPGEELPLTRIDETAVGVEVNRKTGKVVVKERFPDVRDYRITIRDKAPRPKSALKAELDNQLQLGTISKAQYRITAFKEALDIPGLDRAEYENYVAAWLENIIMFGDGNTPVEDPYKANQEADNHAIHLMAHKEFMASVIWRYASAQVKYIFLSHCGYHEGTTRIPQGLQGMGEFGGAGQMNPMAADMASQAAGPGQPGQTPMSDVISAM